MSNWDVVGGDWSTWGGESNYKKCDRDCNNGYRRKCKRFVKSKNKSNGYYHHVYWR